MIAAVVLAAGQSRRMGTQKLLLPWGPSSVIGHIVDQLLETSLSHVCVVVGRDADRVTAALADRPVAWVTNPQPQGDMLSSLRCALRVLPVDCEAALVVLGDQPRITAALVEDLLQAYDTCAQEILVPFYRGRRGHPMLFSRRYFEEVMTQYEGLGLRGLLQAHGPEVCEWPVSIPAVLMDMDTPRDYQRERRRAGKTGDSVTSD
ncbi:MAG: nucleotidyltransferase family protein [Planctomycetes bacterium]|nr:nucleotidyltransferase family protein [Planctomycetota bacterium]